MCARLLGFVCCLIHSLSVYLFYQKLTNKITRISHPIIAFVAILFEHIFRTLSTIACTLFRNIKIVSRLTANIAPFTKLQGITRKKRRNYITFTTLWGFCSNFSCKFREFNLFATKIPNSQNAIGLRMMGAKNRIKCFFCNGKNLLCNYHSTIQPHTGLLSSVYKLCYRNMDRFRILHLCHNRILRPPQRSCCRNFDARFPTTKTTTTKIIFSMQTIIFWTNEQTKTI